MSFQLICNHSNHSAVKTTNLFLQCAHNVYSYPSPIWKLLPSKYFKHEYTKTAIDNLWIMTAARQVCISSTDQWGIRWSTALSQPDSVVDSSSYLAITNLKYKINANISIQGPSPSATIDEALVKVCCDWNNEALVKVLRSKCYNNCIFDLTAKELSDACSYSLYSFVLSQFCLVLLFVHAHHCVPCWLLDCFVSSVYQQPQ